MADVLNGCLVCASLARLRARQRFEIWLCLPGSRSQEEQRLFSFTFWKVEEGEEVSSTGDVFKMSQNSSVLFPGFDASQLLA